MPTPFSPDLSIAYTLDPVGSWPATVHRFDETSARAIKAALVTRRPLLIRGEAGIGKSQLARAAAHVLGVPFLYTVINAQSECTDLLYTYDAVSRLAQAQVLSRDDAAWMTKLGEGRYVKPATLWWAFDWRSARRQAKRACRGAGCGTCEDCCAACGEPPRPDGWEPGKGCVALIDEIDKADSDLPNGLLESLGNNGFQVPHTGEAVAMARDASPPLVVVTTNEERELPAAFLRRCLVLHMGLGKDDDERRTFLLARARDHFDEKDIGGCVRKEAANQLLAERRRAPNLGPALPGAAEYLDLLRALAELYPGDEKKQLAELAGIFPLMLRKNVEEPRP